MKEMKEKTNGPGRIPSLDDLLLTDAYTTPCSSPTYLAYLRFTTTTTTTTMSSVTHTTPPHAYAQHDYTTRLYAIHYPLTYQHTHTTQHIDPPKQLSELVCMHVTHLYYRDNVAVAVVSLLAERKEGME